MSLFISSLNSGSNGNCFYVGNANEAVLIDAGISMRETERRLKRLELSIKKIKAIFITHEHSDHIAGVAKLAKRHQLPVYITQQTLQQGQLTIPQSLVMSFKAYEPVQIGNLIVTGFQKRHDACDPHSFIVSCNGVTVGVFTDIGVACDHVIKHFKKCHAAFLESNYDVDMLANGRYPIFLKNRIRDGYGHLSNVQALSLFMNHRPAFMSHLFLSHLSRNNNSPEIVMNLFSRVAGKTNVIIASRHEETPVYHIHPMQSGSRRLMNAKEQMKNQLSLF